MIDFVYGLDWVGSARDDEPVLRCARALLESTRHRLLRRRGAAIMETAAPEERAQGGLRIEAVRLTLSSQLEACG